MPRKKAARIPVGKKIKTARTQKKYTLDRVANETGFSIDYLKEIEAGKAIPVAHIRQHCKSPIITVFRQVGIRQVPGTIPEYLRIDMNVCTQRILSLPASRQTLSDYEYCVYCIIDRQPLILYPVIIFAQHL